VKKNIREYANQKLSGSYASKPPAIKLRPIIIEYK
jgi:hypothetical protein